VHQLYDHHSPYHHTILFHCMPSSVTKEKAVHMAQKK